MIHDRSKWNGGKMSRFEIDHVALLVGSIEVALKRLDIPASLSAIEEFPMEGTRELYVGKEGSPGRLLLMQPIGHGPYERALQKRGEGLHHLAICIEVMSTFIDSISDTGWLLHPRSLRSRSSLKQIWLCRPGVKALIEVNEGTPCYQGDPIITQVRVPVDPAHEGLLSTLRIRGVAGVVNGLATLTIGSRDIEVQ
jgi:hypothetical protein